MMLADDLLFQPQKFSEVAAKLRVTEVSKSPGPESVHPLVLNQ